ncbi:MAG: DUF2313 domain-containing protein [Deltaproteobacteria bacterium]|nr:DUF2313 domain-containing protein [Deltaproteobacteria bacterium]
MIHLDPPLRAAWLDRFDGTTPDRRYWSAGPNMGTTTLADGVATLALAGGAPAWRSQSLLWPAAAMTFTTTLRVTAHDLANVVAGDRRAGLSIGTDGDNGEFVGVVHDGDGLAVGVDRWREGVTVYGPRIACPDGLIDLKIERDGAAVRLFAAAIDEEFTLLDETADFPATPAMASVLLQTGEGACSSSFDDFAIDMGARCDRVSDLVFGVHVAPRLVIEGRNLPANLVAFYAPPDFASPEAATVSVNADGTRAEIVLPKQAAPAAKLLWLMAENQFVFAEPIRLTVSATGYRVLRALLPPGRYTDDPANPFNVRLAVFGQELDRIEAARAALFGQEIFPETANWALGRHEDMYRLRPGPADTMDSRRARTVAASVRLPSISVPYLNRIVQAVLPGREIVEQESFADFGALKWQYQVHENEPNELAYEDWARLERDLNAYGPGFGLAAVGAADFVCDSSAIERDFCGDGDLE